MSLAENTATITPEWTMGDRLAKARRNAGLTQEEMAGLLGTKKQSVSNWEKDVAQPRNLMEIVGRWSEITKAPRAWLLGVSGIGYNPDAAGRGRLTVIEGSLDGRLRTSADLPLIAVVRDEE